MRECWQAVSSGQAFDDGCGAASGSRVWLAPDGGGNPDPDHDRRWEWLSWSECWRGGLFGGLTGATSFEAAHDDKITVCGTSTTVSGAKFPQTTILPSNDPAQRDCPSSRAAPIAVWGRKSEFRDNRPQTVIMVRRTGGSGSPAVAQEGPTPNLSRRAAPIAVSEAFSETQDRYFETAIMDACGRRKVSAAGTGPELV
jgi:hypothetical protein